MKKLFFLLFFISLNAKAFNQSEIQDLVGNIFNNASTQVGKREIVSTYQGIDIKEANLDHSNIEKKTYDSLSSNESGSFITNSYSTRPQVETDEFSNIFANFNNIVANNSSVIEDSYCDPYNDIEYKICYNNYSNNICGVSEYEKVCTSNLNIYCTNYKSGCKNAGLELSSLPTDLEWTYNSSSETLTIGKKSNANYWDGTCLVVDKTIEFNISNLELVDYFSLNRVVFDDYISVSLNDNVIYVGPYNGTKLEVINNRVDDGINNSRSCELSTIWNQYLNIGLTNFLKLGKNILKMRVIVSGSGQGSMDFILRNKCCTNMVDSWVEVCNNEISSTDTCILKSKICNKKDYFFMFEGLELYKVCGEYTQIYQCKNNNDNCYNYYEDCGSMNLINCNLEKTEFIDSNNYLERLTYKCLTPLLEPKDCEKNISCLDGDCYNLSETQDVSSDMVETLTILGSINESIATIDETNLSMLNGEVLKCKKSTSATASFKDCCGDANWGNALTADCHSEEEKLKIKREENLCVFVGKYCVEELLGVCLAKKYSFCCFENIFAKIIGKASLQQGFTSWGSAENTTCSGISIESFKDLDFTQIDFGELYENIESSIDTENIQTQILNNINNIQNGAL